METEYEATFTPVDPGAVRDRLARIGAVPVRKRTLMRRTVFNPPAEKQDEHVWLRVRDEGDRITLSMKRAEKRTDGYGIEDMKELCLTVDDYANAAELLRLVGCEEKAYQETWREAWRLGDVEVTIDEWPFLAPLIEIEGPDEFSVRTAAAALGYDYAKDARFCSATELYAERYGITPDRINNRTPRITFDDPNPFIDGIKNHEL